MKNLKTILLLGWLCLLSVEFTAQTTHPNFIMFWHFTDITGENIISNQEICDCGTVYIQNKSTYNNGLAGGSQPIGTGLITGDYQVWIVHLGVPSVLNIATIPAEDWLDDGSVYPITVPCGYNITDLAIEHTGPGTSPYYIDPISSEKMSNPLINHIINVNAGPDQTVCANTAFTLEGTGTGSDFNWTPDGGSLNPTMNIWASSTQTFTLTNSQNYSTTSQGVLTCSATDDVVVNIEHGPNLDLNDYLLCDDEPMPILTGGLSPVTYEWTYTPSGEVWGSVVASTPTINTGLFGFGTYKLRAYSDFGCLSTGTSSVEMSPSAGSEVNSDFTYTAINSFTTTTISANSTESGVHRWKLFNSDALGNTPVLPIESIFTPSASHTFSAQPLNSFYKITHEFYKSPCYQISESDRLTYSGSRINIYPNPVAHNQQFTIELMDQSISGTIDITDLSTGQTVFTQQIQYGTTLNTSLPAAHYNIKLVTSSEVIQRMLIVQ